MTKPSTTAESEVPEGAFVLEANPPDTAQPDAVLTDLAEDQTADLAADRTADQVAHASTRRLEPVDAPAPAVRRKSGPVLAGILIGAALAAGAGYGVQRYLVAQPIFDPTPLEARLTAAETEAQALRAEIARLSEAPLEAPVPDQALLDRIAALENAAVQAVQSLDIAPLTARLDGVEANLAALANLPSETGVSPAALAALQAEVAALKSQDAGVPAEISAMADAVTARLTEAESRAAALTAQATEIAADATRNAALIKIGAALDSGLPYSAALAALGDAPIPEALSAYADTGAPSIATLRAAFPDAARAALEQGLRANPGETWTDRVGTFLRNQTGARSLTARDGSDPDAVLSRAEVALAQADLPAALTELAALPPEAQTALAGWTALAQQRLDAQTALAGLQGAGQ